MTQESFAARVEVDVTPEHLSLVLHGKRVSPPLVAKVDAFIAKHLGKERVTANAL